MDIALAVDNILPGAKYFGSVTANTQEAWDAVVWKDSRIDKPTWEELEAAMPDPILEARAAKQAEIMQKYDAAFAGIEATYPAKEREGWTIQEAEARALQENPEAETPVLSMLVVERGIEGETVEILAAKVMAHAEHWRTVYAHLTGQQQRMHAEVSALDTVEAVQGYDVSYTMPEGLEG